jgi:hypothetical protein
LTPLFFKEGLGEIFLPPAFFADRFMKKCHACLKVLEITTPVGRRENCPFCRADLHCCLNCAHYATGAYNECREPQAERVMEKNRSNFCDYFVFRDVLADAGEGKNRDVARESLESLFKKG